MRIIGLDATRSLAIVLAMSSHVYADVNIGTHLPDPVVRMMWFFFQFATPTFILLFGTMLEIVYQPRWTTPLARHRVATRLLSRAFQCWVLYALTIFVLFLTDDGYSIKYSIAAVLFMGNSPYAEILKFYAITLAFAPVLLWLRGRFGLWPLVIAAIAYHAAWPLLTSLPDVESDLGAPRHIASLSQFLTGFGELSRAGPSILHGLTLVVVGQCLGNYLVGQSRAGLQGLSTAGNAGFGRRVRTVLVGGVMLALIGGLFIDRTVIDGLSQGLLRRDSHPMYFAAGILSATVMTMLFVWLIDVHRIGRTDAWVRATFFGRTSMFTFAWGNILLYLVDLTPDTLGATLAWAAALLAAICAMSIAFDIAARRSTVTAAGLRWLGMPGDRLAQGLLWASRGGRPVRG
ncbi:heparan-alpha-glucosaminide N-acetyltransferase domain-containing protein [Paracoccus sp. Ld10]|uniref:heparan-alpha-glucosaminide N-acetyltransferase domain-containing protein n=1 Tax=Paracoccus sp. Ld10 TaxID=649158 RepID=UPI003870918C